MPRVQTGEIETYYERRGSGPPVVFVHGAILDHAEWAPQMDALADSYTCYAYDVRGHGRTGGSAVGRYTFDLWADDLAAFVDPLAIERPVLVGLSMGGVIAQVYAARHPERVAGLVLASTFTPELPTRRDWFLRGPLLRALVYPAMVVGYERVERAKLWLYQRLAGEGTSGDYAEIEALREGSPTMATAEFAKVVRTLARSHDEAIDYDAITAPTLILHGADEPGMLTRQTAILAERIADATVVEVPDASHALNLDNPAFFTDAVSDFLGARVPTGSPAGTA